MEKEININVIKETQSSLGKYIKRPPLTEKLLRKPPFRFIHDIVTTVLKTTGFFEGLFDENELLPDNVKDRESKILFLNKVITVLNFATGITLTVKPSKIVAGQEPEKSNELLQCLAQALNNNISSTDAVKKYKENYNNKNKKIDKEKVQDVQSINKNDKHDKKIVSRSKEKLTTQKKEVDRVSNKSETNKINSKSKEDKDTKLIKKSQSQNKNVLKKLKLNELEKIDLNDKDEKETLQLNDEITDGLEAEAERIGDTVSNENIIQRDIELNTLNSKTIPVENKFDVETDKFTLPNLSIDKSSEDNEIENKVCEISPENINPVSKKEELDIKNDGSSFADDEIQPFQEMKEKVIYTSKPKNSVNDEVIEKKSENKDYNKNESHNKNIRPSSVRPTSSRPGAPRLREKHDDSLTNADNLLMGKVNIIVENSINDEEEEPSIVIDSQTNTLPSETANEIQSTNQHGLLVQQILESQKELSQISTGKTEIAWEIDAKKAKESSNQEIEQIRFNVQALSRITNPLGKLLDHIQEDVEFMRQELQQWTQNYQEAAKELAKQKTINEDSLLPLHTKIKQLDMDIENKHEKINDLKIIIYRNNSRINNLLAIGDVQ